MTDTERETLCARIDELCAEVERLRVANAAFTGRSIRAGDKMACLEAENAKLRKLATMLHICARGMLRDLAPSCVDRSKEGCGMDCTGNGERCCMEMLERRMRELGIEVA